MKINVFEFFESTCLNNPDKVAVIERDNKLNFQELDQRTKIISSLIGRRKIINRPVAVYLEKSIDSVCIDLGITRSGNVYMNLDVKTPLERVKNILHLVNPDIIFTNSFFIKNIKEICSESTTIININDVDYSGESKLTNGIEDRFSEQIDCDPYCIINTSGSTGTPKSVVLNHRSFTDFTLWAITTLKIDGTERIGSLSPTVFDIWSFELCMLMFKGSTIVILPENLAAFPAALLNFMNEKQVSFIFWVPTIMVNIANMDLFSKIDLPALKTIWFAGEVLPTKQFNYWKRHLPDRVFVNLYGPIEITLDCTYFIIDRELRDDEPIPIGFPCRNTDILILNESDEPVDINEPGELCVRGTSLAMGYYNNPEKTNAVFTQNPLNKSYPEIIYRTGDQVYKNEHGEIIFKGRKDTLVKHLGYRIELGEIEHIIINTLQLVENGCVIYNHEKKQIILIYEGKKEISAMEFRKEMLEVLPKYMVPGIFIKIEELPRNTNGKIDRLSLGKKYGSL